MKVKLPEPVGEPLIYYHKEIENENFNSLELKEFIEGTKRDLDKACEKINESVLMVNFYSTFLDLKTKKELEFMSWTSDLTVYGYGRAVSGIKRYYTEGFDRLLDKIENKNYCLDIVIDFIGFKDKITGTVETIEPPNLNIH